ncbi:hypothetical protein [Roseimicrobium gellanilyticum]|uniref:hypothetical protein n=1 Tax=Roseimicrobium gellanilyticum TaxID=748857 RepID=UPI0011BE1FC4|nr:hypothetical protein [Roseimicrobium gellanilyticum]
MANFQTRRFVRTMQQVAENLWVARYPMKLLGANLGRTVTIIRIGGQVVIHSTAPFSAADAAAIRELGTPAWMVEGATIHDTYTVQGRAVFPEADMYLPPGFPDTGGGVAPKPLTQPPAEWHGLLEVLPIAGMPGLNEYVFLHVPSRTLIVADLVFNVPTTAGAWVRLLLKLASGLQGGPGVSRIFLKEVKDEAAFKQSLTKMMQWDFERVIVGHGDIIERGGKETLARLFREKGLLPSG